jgi:hypothetical protein
VSAWRFSTRRAAWEEVADFCGQFFRFSLNKTSAVESSSHAPSRASGRLSRGAAHFFVARSVGWMEEKMAHLSKRVLDQGMLEDR